MKKIALCVGINDYPGTDSDLSGCVNDVIDGAAMLIKRGFDVLKISDSKATKKTMEKEIVNIVSQKDSLIVIQYSGHGSFVPDLNGDEPDGTDECLCPYDIRENGPIIDDWLYHVFIDKGQGSKVVMLSDSCHSGTVAKFAPITTPYTLTKKCDSPTRLVRFLPPSVFLSKRETSSFRVIYHNGSPPGREQVLLMAGCQDTEYSYDAWFNGRPNGAFTYVALKALDKLKPNATYQQWYQAIRKVLPSRQYPQTPNLYGSWSMRNWKVLK